MAALAPDRVELLAARRPEVPDHKKLVGDTVMALETRMLRMAVAILSMAASGSAVARDASRPASQTPAHAIPNPYAPPAPAAPSSGNRTTDAYSMGFGIGLGTALINNQREDEAKRLWEQSKR